MSLQIWFMKELSLSTVPYFVFVLFPTNCSILPQLKLSVLKFSNYHSVSKSTMHFSDLIWLDLSSTMLNSLTITHNPPTNYDFSSTNDSWTTLFSWNLLFLGFCDTIVFLVSNNLPLQPFLLSVFKGIYSFILVVLLIYLLSICYMPGTVPGAGDRIWHKLWSLSPEKCTPKHIPEFSIYFQGFHDH